MTRSNGKNKKRHGECREQKGKEVWSAKVDCGVDGGGSAGREKNKDDNQNWKWKGKLKLK